MKKTNQFFLFLNYRQKSKRTNLGKVNSKITFFNDRKKLKGTKCMKKLILLCVKIMNQFFLFSYYCQKSQSPVFKCRKVDSMQSRCINFLPLLMMGGWNLVCKETTFWHLKTAPSGPNASSP